MAEKNNSLEKALSVLDLFQTKSRYTLTEIAQKTGYSVAAVSRILNTLCDCNYLFQDKLDNGYYLTNKLYVLGTGTLLSKQLVNVLDEVIGNLCHSSGFSATISIREGYDSVIVMNKDPDNAFTLVRREGERMSLNSTATGKILVAFSGKSDELIKNIEYVKLTEKTISNRRDFTAAIKEIKETGIAYDMEEVTAGLVCVAAPVLGSDGNAICSVSLSGYKDRMIEQMDDTINKLKETVSECEALLN